MQDICIATRSRVFWLFSGGITPLSEPSVPSLRSYGSMRSWCIHDGYEAFLTMRWSIVWCGEETVRLNRSWKLHPG